MDESVISQIRDLLAGSETVGIVVGKNPSLDALGAVLALYLSLQASGKKVTAASATEPLVEHSNLVGIDKIRANFEEQGGDLGDLIVSFPYREGEIDKVSYTLDDGALNIVVKPGELGLSFTEQDVVFRRKGEYPQLIFTIGVPRISDLASVFDINALKDTMIVNIDNKVDNQGFGDAVMVSPQSSSVSEQVASLLTSLGFEIGLDTAQNLLSGIQDATNNFQSPKTSAAAFEMVGILMNKGAARAQFRKQQEEREFPPQDQGQVLQQLTQRQDQRRQSSSQRGEQPRRDQRGRNFPPRRDQNQNQNQSQYQQEQRQPSVSPTQQGSGQAGQSLKNPPEDWFTPKVYKGSTNV
ncbi:MAG: hypothetical protein HYU48_01630 [Candidatus Levybacteria bacterium]|nr:hypothetical protein [Candidatus Levybacteria bacterium]